MKKKKLLKEAKRRYPIGTKVKCAFGGDVQTVDKHKFAIDSSGDVYCYTDSMVGVFLTNECKWAEIIEPKSELQLLEEKYNRVEDKQKKRAERIAELNNKHTLHLIVDDNGYLTAELSDGTELGFIDDEGMCFILNCDTHHANWELWKEHGMKVSDEVVEWRGGKYQILDYVLTRKDIFKGAIYDFRVARQRMSCEDENIQRHSNGTVKIY